MLSSNIALLFPGQGSQFVGMGKELAEEYPIARQVFDEADQVLGLPISRLAWEGPERELNDTINTQPALFTHAIAAYRVLQEKHPALMPTFTAGHSMGQLTALVAAGALAFEDGLRLVRRRGELMKQAGEKSPGGMAAIIGLDITTLEQICTQASRPGEMVQVANDNCPGQVVISGEKAALDRAMALAQTAKARKVVPLSVSIAAHSPLMAHAQADFNQAVRDAAISDPQIPIIGNVAAVPLASAEEIMADLQAQLTSRVRWTESIQFMLANGVETFLEVGSGKVLTALLKRIARKSHRINLGTPGDFANLA